MRISTPSRPIGCRLVLSLLVVLSCGVSAPAEGGDLIPTFRVLAENGDSIDGRPGATASLVGARDVLSLDRQGRAFLDGVIDGPNGGEAFFVADESGLRAPFALGDAAPALGIPASGSTVANIVEAYASPEGDLIAAVELAGGQQPGEALLTEFDGVLRVAAARNVAFGGLCNLSDIGNGISTRQFAAHGDTVVFHGIRDLGTCGDDKRGVYRVPATGGAVETVALEDASVPGAPGETFDLLFFGPALNADGAYFFTGRYDDPNGPGLTTALFLAPGAGAGQTAPTLIARTGTTVPGTAFKATGITSYSVGNTPDGGSRPRTVYSVEAFIKDANQLSYQYVFDSARGSDPALGTGTTDGDFTFAAGLPGLSSRFGLASAKDDVLVVVADTTGPNIPSGGEAVWRLDPLRSQAPKVVLSEGGPIPGCDPRATGLTIKRLLTVHLNEQGRLAVECELSNNLQAILMEDSDPDKADEFHIVVQRRDRLPMRSGMGVASGLLGEIPSSPRVRGPGTDGRQSRFNDRGEFVFRAFMNPDDNTANRSVIYTVSTDPARELCDVKVKQRGRNLSIVGGKSGCDVTVRSGADGSFEIVPGTDTTVNGKRTPLSLTGVLGNITIYLGDGDDVLRLTSDDPACDQDSSFDVIGNLTIGSGDGNDVVQISNFEVRRTLTVDLGNTGTESLSVDDTCVGRSLKVAGKRVVTTARFANCVVEGSTKMSLPGAPVPSPAADFDFVGCAFAKVVIRGSAFPDEVRFDRCTAAAAVKIDTRQGVLEDVRINDSDFESSVRINGSKCGHLVARLTELRANEGGLRVDTGKNGCQVQVIQCHIARRLDFRTGGAPDGSGNLNDIDVDNSLIEGSLVLKGKGPQDFVLTRGSTVAQGISINSKGGPIDQIVLFDFEVEEGHVTVQSRAENSFIRVSKATVTGGDVRIRGTKGKDQAFVVDSNVSGTVQVILDKGDDEATVSGTTIGRNLRLFGGGDRDLLNGEVDTSNTVTGETVKRDFEGTLPQVPPAK